MDGGSNYNLSLKLKNPLNQNFVTANKISIRFITSL